MVLVCGCVLRGGGEGELATMEDVCGKIKNPWKLTIKTLPKVLLSNYMYLQYEGNVQYLASQTTGLKSFQEDWKHKEAKLY